MQKVKLTIALIVSVVAITFGVRSASAATIVSIQTLPSFINSNNFKLSCTSNGSSAQFFVSKHGGALTAFGPAIDLTSAQCIVQVTSSEINDETDYTFTVTVDGSQSSSTSTVYDSSGPSPVSNYHKEKINDGQNKLYWTNPGNTDFDKVVIYRGDAAGFSADGGHEIARVGGTPNSDMTYNDSYSPDPTKNYFYAIRAIDHAGNSSSLSGDSGTTTGTAGSGTPVPGGSSGSGISVPGSQGTGGSVLGTEATPSPSSDSSPTSTTEEATQSANTGLWNWIMTHKKISLGVPAILLFLGYFGYRFTKKG